MKNRAIRHFADNGNLFLVLYFKDEEKIPYEVKCINERDIEINKPKQFLLEDEILWWFASTNTRRIKYEICSNTITGTGEEFRIK